MFMINFIKGTVLNRNENLVTIDVQGIGFQVQIPDTSIIMKGEPVSLYIYLQWHQEQGPVLFGFSSELEKTTFQLIISCSGIGPKIALAILSAMKPTSFLKAIQTDDQKCLSAVNGIGAKKAEQIIVQLRHKVTKLLESGVVIEDDRAFEQWKNISEVLTSLHYSRSEVSNALQYVQQEAGSSDAHLTFDYLLRKALAFLSKRT